MSSGTMTARACSLVVALTTAALWLLWADRFDAGARVVLTTAWLWWWAALQATWRVWLPAGGVLAGLYAAIPPRAPRRPQLRLVRAAVPPVPAIIPLPTPSAVVSEREPSQEPGQETPPAAVPAPVPAPPRTVWEAFAPLHQERDDGAAS